MKQKIHPLAAAALILAAASIVFAVMWRASEAPKWNRLPPAMAASPPARMAPAPRKPGKQASPPSASRHAQTVRPPTASHEDTGSARR